MGERDVKVSEIRFISPEPVLAEILAAYQPRIMSKALWRWFVNWVRDIGTIMRSREYIAYNIAYIASYVVLSGLVTVVETLVGTRLTLVRKWVTR